MCTWTDPFETSSSQGGGIGIVVEKAGQGHLGVPRGMRCNRIQPFTIYFIHSKQIT